jgi:hypothetical protein
VGIRLSDCPDHTNQLVNSIKGPPRKLELVLALLVLFSPSPHVIDRSVAIMRLAIDWSRWTTSPYYAIVILIIACGSIPKGYDEGGFSASVNLESFVNDFHLAASEWTNNKTELANRRANITSFNVLGAAFGALLALDLNDRLGRLRSWRLACLIWAAGLFVQVFSSGIYGLILAARLCSGLGAGILTVSTPLYLSEIGMGCAIWTQLAETKC